MVKMLYILNTNMYERELYKKNVRSSYIINIIPRIIDIIFHMLSLQVHEYFDLIMF